MMMIVATMMMMMIENDVINDDEYTDNDEGSDTAEKYLKDDRHIRGIE